MKIKYEVKKEEELPLLEEVLPKFMTPGTMLGKLEFQAEPILFQKSPLSPVKSLKVNIISTESSDMAVLHQLHSKTRTS